jgi:hypothetical protein
MIEEFPYQGQMGTVNSLKKAAEPDKRIRLKLKDIQMIAKALRFYEENNKGAIYDEPDWKDKSKRLMDLSRRFHILSKDEGWAARRSKQ